MPINAKSLPSRDYLIAKIIYDPETGSIIWKRRPLENFASYNAFKTWNSRFAGKEAGWQLKVQDKIYVMLTIDYEKYLAHRVIWKIMKNEDPIEEIDHEDGDGSNNRWTNLREAGRPQNTQNRVTRKNSMSGYKGVRQLPNGKFQAYIVIDRKFTGLGTFGTPQEASEAYYRYAKTVYKEFANQGGEGHATIDLSKAIDI